MVNCSVLFPTFSFMQEFTWKKNLSHSHPVKNSAEQDLFPQQQRNHQSNGLWPKYQITQVKKPAQQSAKKLIKIEQKVWVQLLYLSLFCRRPAYFQTLEIDGSSL